MCTYYYNCSILLLPGQRGLEEELSVATSHTMSRQVSRLSGAGDGERGGDMKRESSGSDMELKMKAMLRDELLINAQKFASQVHVHVCVFVCLHIQLVSSYCTFICMLIHIVTFAHIQFTHVHIPGETYHPPGRR